MDKQIINFGIIATGRIARSFAEAVNFVDGAKLLAVSSRNLSSAMKFADEFNIPRSYQGYEEMCKDKDIDVIYIATPTSCHYENVKLCFEYGKNVICEKAVTENTEELMELISLAKEKGLFFMEAMWMKCRPNFLQALEWAREGKIGKIKMIKADFSNIVKFDGEDRLFKKELGASALLDLGIYPISLFTAFLGNYPEKITSRLFYGRTDADFDGTVTLDYGDGFATTVFGYDIENHNNCVIVGEKGRITFDDWFFCCCGVKLYDEYAQVVEEKNFPNLCNGYEYEVEEVCKCLREGRLESELVPHEDTIATMKIMETVFSQNF
ncbi:MAG: Gfo/Idh/MocA family oxidoreductase [Oscillospiraceae bacterium]|nr:Gfo/Idh/MocA family oxidoreductase [Oscillospiraceae bacterium]MBQ8379060.1 Gfo/Idh/MocA family oxidoreductase [Oscillospiraceae bacterium]